MFSFFAETRSFVPFHTTSFRANSYKSVIINILLSDIMLGHAKVSTTEDIYSHVIEESKQLASNALADVYFRGKRREA